MVTQTKLCLKSCVLCSVFVLISIKDSSRVEANQPSRLGTTEDGAPSYFFYQQSRHPRDCLEVLSRCSSTNQSGVYAIKPDGLPEVFDVHCDNEGYTVIGRRLGGLIGFSRSWEAHTSGFGFLSHEFWLGNRKLSYLTNQKRYQFRVDVTLKDGASFFVTYDDFRITDAFSNYQLISTGQYSATVVTCPNNMVPGSCICQRTCAEPDTCNTSRCHVTGLCVCPTGYLMSDGYCIPKKECGCFIAENGRGAVLKDGGTYVSRNCDSRCSCTSNQLICDDDFQCSSYASCEEGTNGGNCSCNPGYDGDGVQCTAVVTATDCWDVFSNGQTASGQYSINPGWSQDPHQVYCNMENGGGWTVVQRQDGSENFYRNWTDYKNGFGSLDRGMWLGNDKLYSLTNHQDYELRIDLTARDNQQFYATYSLFKISDESDKYKVISVGSYDGDAGDDNLQYLVDVQFSTYDQDNDGWSNFDCAEQHHGGWWFGYSNDYYYYYHCPSSNSDCRRNCPSGEDYCEYFPVGSGCAYCSFINLNANKNSTTRGRNIFWDGFAVYDCGLLFAEMKIRPVSK